MLGFKTLNNYRVRSEGDFSRPVCVLDDEVYNDERKECVVFTDYCQMK